jgi:hypothetical protein
MARSHAAQKRPKARPARGQNALKHGLRAQRHIVLPGESAAEFAALEAALMEELAPEGALQGRARPAGGRRDLAARARRVLGRAVRAGVVVGIPGHAMIRDGNGARAFDTLLRYRGGTLAERWRALRTLKALQAEQAARPEPAVTPEPRLLAEPHEVPIKPESRANPDDSPPPQTAIEPVWPRAAMVPAAIPCDRAARPKLPDQPESHGNPGEFGRPGDRAEPGPAEPPPSIATKIAARGCASLLAGTALVPLGRPR